MTTNTSITARLFRRALTILLLAFGLLAPAAQAALTVVVPTATTPGSLTIHQDISLPITTGNAGNTPLLVLDEWVTHDGGATCLPMPPIVYSVNGGANQSTAGSTITDSLGITYGATTPNDGWIRIPGLGVLNAGDTLTVRSGTYVIPANPANAALFNPQGNQTFAGNVFLVSTADNSRLSPDVQLPPLPQFIASGGWVNGANFTIGTVGTANDTNNWPATESPEQATDGNVNTKFLLFKGSNAGLIITPFAGAAAYNRLALTTAGDAPERDPASYIIYGSTTALPTSGNIDLSSLTLIQQGTLALTDARTTGPSVVQFANTTAYASYVVVFPAVKNNQGLTQIAEVKLSQGLTVPNQVAMGKARGGLFSDGPIDVFLLGTIGTANPGNNWPAGQSPDNALDGDVNANFLLFRRDGIGLIASPEVGATVVNSLSFWTAADARERDPASYQVYGSTVEVTHLSDPQIISSAAWTLIQDVTPLALPDARLSGPTTVTFANTTAYASYLVVFPAVKNVDQNGNPTPGNNITQIGEVAFAYNPPTTAPEIAVYWNDGDTETEYPLLSGESQAFGSVNVGSARGLDFRIWNLGTAPLMLTGSPRITMTGSADFAVSAQPPESALPPMFYSDFRVTFTPSSAGSKTATLTIANNDSDEGTYTIVLNGTGVVPNAAPTDITLSNATIAENNAPGATIGTLTATDADVADTHTFTFAGGVDDGAFTLTGATLTINASADFETKSSYAIRLRATDSRAGNLTYEENFIITISDVTLPQVITFAPLGGKTFGDADFTVSATGGASGQPVTFTASGAATVTGNTVSITGAGSATITAHQAGSGDYSAAADVARAFTVAQAAQSITFTPPATALPTDTVTLTATGGASGNAVTFALVSGPGSLAGDVLTFTGTGPVVVRASQAGNANYLAAADVEATITVGSGAKPAVDDAVTITTGDATLYPLANDGNPNATITSVSEPTVTIAGRTLIVPAGFAGDFTYTTSDAQTATVTVLIGTPVANASKFQGLLYDSTGAISGILKATKSTNVISASIQLGTATGSARIPVAGGVGVAFKLGTIDCAIDADGRLAVSIVSGGETFTGSIRPAQASATAEKHHIALASIDTSTIPGGGYLTAALSANGKIGLTGKLPDGRAFAGNSSLLDNGSIVLYRPIKKTKPKGVIGGELILADLTATDVTGELAWSLPAQATGPHSGGVESVLTANGSIFNPANPLPDGAITVTLSGAGLAEEVAVSTTASSGNVAKTGAIADWETNAAKGTFRMDTKPEGFANSVGGSGVFLQKSNTAWGYFKGTTTGGKIELATDAP